jgi:ATPase subunit of ABC transporter with duplicated ATPase domains
MPTWRSRVSLVSQDRTTMDGTPGEFFLKTLQYRSQQDRLAGSSYADNNDNSPQDQHDDPVEIAREWDLSERVFDQPWSTLSGGEAQRASLAIALALRPEVLLLDESTSALDEQTTLKVETTLKKMGLPLLMVSHSRDQVNRFCTNVLNLEDSSAGRAEVGFKNRF